jgi:hypothetical protein
VTVAALCLALDVLLRAACPPLHARMAALSVPVAAFALGWVSTLGLGGGEAPPLVAQASGVRWVLLQCLTHGGVGWLRVAGAACTRLRVIDEFNQLSPARDVPCAGGAFALAPFATAVASFA